MAQSQNFSPASSSQAPWTVSISPEGFAWNVLGDFFATYIFYSANAESANAAGTVAIVNVVIGDTKRETD